MKHHGAPWGSKSGCGLGVWSASATGTSTGGHAETLAFPLARTQHPESPFSQVEADLSSSVAALSARDAPVAMEDPYQPPPSLCILCPQRYAPGHAPAPSYLNPKLLSQFTSPHTGKVYEKHITGLCAKMQEKVEQEVGRSQAAGLMSHRVKNVEYLQDPQIVNAAKPHMPNPH